jgi:hypothetical protein
MQLVAVPIKTAEEEASDLGRELHHLESHKNINGHRDAINACMIGLMNLDSVDDPYRILDSVRERIDYITSQLKRKRHLTAVNLNNGV